MRQRSIISSLRVCTTDPLLSKGGRYWELPGTRLERDNGPEELSDDSQGDVRIIWKRCRTCVLENLVVLSISDVQYTYERFCADASLLHERSAPFPELTFSRRRKTRELMTRGNRLGDIYTATLI